MADKGACLPGTKERRERMLEGDAVAACAYCKEENQMISDVLFQAREDIQSYLDEPTYAEVYSGELRAEIEHVMAAMASLLQKLDRPPTQDEQQRTSG